MTLRLILVAVIGIALAILARQLYGAGYAAYRAEQATAALRAEQERRQTDEALRGLDDHDLCQLYARRMRRDGAECEPLRGLPPH